jgi:putative drug exporter of the RND superfamily
VKLPWSVNPDRQFWARLARGVMKRPLLVALPTLFVLLAMGYPFLHLRLAAADVRVLDQKVEARRGEEMLKAAMPDQVANRVLIAIEFPSSPALNPARVHALVELTHRLESMPHVTSVESLFAGDPRASDAEIEAGLLNPPPELAAAVGEAMALSVGDRVVTMHVLNGDSPDSEEARDLVKVIRANRSVADGTISVGGDTASDIDATTFIRGRAPYAIGFVVGVSFLLLLFVFRSVVLPMKAVLMNCLSMCGSFGALVWIFQDGHFGIREPRPLEPTLPVLLFCVLFGLSMDYEVLLLSRVQEAYKRSGDNTEAVAEGLQRTAGLITSAAAIMVAVFTAFAFAHVVMIQAVGVGMALSVALDATLVRTLLVPSTMRLLGRLNWWAPGQKATRGDAQQPTTSPAHVA